MALHDYLSRDSCHSGSTFQGVATGEIIRHLRRSSSYDSAIRSLLLLVPRLVNRGYDLRSIKQKIWHYL
eukprot:6471594-Amphidinium_carterae.1